ncbi:MAG TPA: potassium-transporting ATPase subunit B, partial [Pseudonocardiaceae bacterium]|nr:potassium-transporting ATPase subunit B [Pseudonocardiaceae bacterium]
MTLLKERQPTGAEKRAARAGVPAGAFSPRQLVSSLPDAVRKLDPRHQLRNPVMFVVWVGSVLVTVLAVVRPGVFAIAVAAWLWFTVLFANLAESVAEGRGKAQAASLRATRSTTIAHRVVAYDERTDPDALRGELEEIPSADLKLGDVVVVSAGELIPGDGDVIAGIASVDESAITGESAPVVRESGGDRSAVTGGTRVLSDRVVV